MQAIARRLLIQKENDVVNGFFLRTAKRVITRIFVLFFSL